MTTMKKEFAEIDAHHQLYSLMNAEIKLLRILLYQSKTGRESLQDKWKIQEIVQQHPSLAETYDIEIWRKM